MNWVAEPNFWPTLENLLHTHRLVIDRPSGTLHPRYPAYIYPLDYGYLDGVRAGDGDGLDVWLGTAETKTLTGILCTFDTVKRDAEMKLVVGCSEADLQAVLHFYSDDMPCLFIRKPGPSKDPTTSQEAQ